MNLDEAKPKGHAEPVTRAWDARLARIEQRLADIAETGEQYQRYLAYCALWHRAYTRQLLASRRKAGEVMISMLVAEHVLKVLLTLPRPMHLAAG
jgi:hypothetical protein